MRILVADADEVAVAALRQKLAQTPNAVIETAGCGTDAWILLTTFHERFDAAVIDILLPDMSGLELLKKIRRQPNLEKLPVVICTKVHDRNTVIDALALGVKHYLIKPTTPEVIQARIQDSQSNSVRI